MNLIKKVEDHFDLMPAQDFIRLFKSNLPNKICPDEANLLQIEEYKSIIKKSVIVGYNEFLTRLELREKLTLDIIDLYKKNTLPDYYKTKSYLCHFYRNAIFISPNDDVKDYLKNFKIRDPYLTNFIAVETVENILFEIIHSGVFINISIFFGLIDFIYTYRITKDFFKYHLANKKRDSYRRGKDVSEAFIEYINIEYNYLYQSDRPHPKSDFATYMELFLAFSKAMQDELTFIDFKGIFRSITDGKNSPQIRSVISYTLKSFYGSWGRKKVLEIFKPYFYILFENTIDGLLTEEEFEKKYVEPNVKNGKTLNESDLGKYDGNYNKYYSTRIKTLCGI